jgi:hypothetical protein
MAIAGVVLSAFWLVVVVGVVAWVATSADQGY